MEDDLIYPEIDIFGSPDDYTENLHFIYCRNHFKRLRNLFNESDRKKLLNFPKFTSTKYKCEVMKWLIQFEIGKNFIYVDNNITIENFKHIIIFPIYDDYDEHNFQQVGIRYQFYYDLFINTLKEWKEKLTHLELLRWYYSELSETEYKIIMSVFQAKLNLHYGEIFRKSPEILFDVIDFIDMYL